MKKPRTYKPCIFTQDYGTYTNEILVMSGISDKKKVFAYLKKIRANVDFTKWVLTDFDELRNRLGKTESGLFAWNDKVNGTVLFLKQCSDSWDFWEALMHECSHIVHRIAKKKGFLENEVEAQAYLFEYLFRSIRRKLTGLDPLK